MQPLPAILLPSLASVSLIFGSLAGCESDTCRLPKAETIDSSADTYRYVVKAIAISGSARMAHELAMHIDNDGLVDNLIGAVLGTIGSNSEYDLSAEANALVASGELLQLIDVQTQDFANAAGVGVQVALGKDLDGDPSNNHSGNEALALDLAVQPGLMSGSVADGALVVELGTAPLAVTFPGLGERFVFQLSGARLEATMTEDGLEGKIGGAISTEEVSASMLPALAEGFARAIASDCPDKVCVDGSFGKLLIELLDTSVPSDFVITVKELQDASLVQAFTQPDVDIFNEDGQLAPGCDGVAESLSISVGFSAVRATIAP